MARECPFLIVFSHCNGRSKMSCWTNSDSPHVESRDRTMPSARIFGSSCRTGLGGKAVLDGKRLFAGDPLEFLRCGSTEPFFLQRRFYPAGKSCLVLVICNRPVHRSPVRVESPRRRIQSGSPCEILQFTRYVVDFEKQDVSNSFWADALRESGECLFLIFKFWATSVGLIR
jgi:hypothetical protein